jgi:site-specific recombinase XerD
LRPGFSFAQEPPQLSLSARHLHDRCKQIAKAAGLDAKEWHLHKFRDRVAPRWLRPGIDVRTVQAWLGHKSLATTQKYLAVLAVLGLEMSFTEVGASGTLDELRRERGGA